MARNPETNLQLRIMVALAQTCVLVRVPAGMFWAGKFLNNVTINGRPVTNVIINPAPVKVAMSGHPDLAGYRRSDGRAVYIEVKTRRGVVTKDQQQFIDQAKQAGCLAGIARSVKEAEEIVRG